MMQAGLRGALKDAIIDHFQFQSVQGAVELVTPGCFFACLDLAYANCIFKFHESNFKATGFKLRFSNDKHYTYMIDVRLTFGMSRSPLIFHSIMQAVSAIMAKKGFNTILCYLDDL